MCLFISRFWHGKNPKPKIAKRDIHVWKGLMKFNNYPFYYTPYQQSKILFLKGVATQIADLRQERRVNSIIITEGIHAALTKRKLRSILKNICLKNQSFHHAIIPKGSKYYIGFVLDQDIVSDKLLVFETEEAYKYYRKKTGRQ